MVVNPTTKYTSIIFYPDGSIISHQLSKKPSLRDLQLEVGGFLESVPGLLEFQGTRLISAYWDEEAKAKSRPVNPTATAIFYSSGGSGDVVRGPLLLLFKGSFTLDPAKVPSL